MNGTEGQGVATAETPADAGNKNWAVDFQHESLAAPEAREAFVKSMGGYESPEAAIVGGYQARTAVGKKADDFISSPEGSKYLDKLGVLRKPGKDAKPEQILAYKQSMLKELGAVEKPEDLNDIDFTVGMAKVEGVENKADEGLKAVLSKWAVGKPKDIVQDGIRVWNETMAAAVKQNEIAFKQRQETAHAKHIEISGSEGQEKIDTELIRRWAVNHTGLTGDEGEKFGQWLVDSGLTIDAEGVAFKALKYAANLHKEGVTEVGKGGKVEEKKEKTFGEQVVDVLNSGSSGKI